MEQEYFEKLFDAKLEHVESNQIEIKKMLDKILEQTTITNGRVRELERWQANVLGGDNANEKNNKKISGWLIAFVSFLTAMISTVLTMWATKLWH